MKAKNNHIGIYCKRILTSLNLFFLKFPFSLLKFVRQAIIND